MKKRILLIISLSGLLGISPKLAGGQKTETWLTVFVHGIMSIKPHLSAANFLRFMTDDVHQTVYARTVELMREDPVFFQNQPMQQIGLIKLDPQKPSSRNASNTLAMVFESMNSLANPNPPTDNHYYTFGWTGLLSSNQRIADSERLYAALCTEVAAYKARGIEPHVRVIGYSHGGNVCLNLARAAQENPNNKLTVDEVILLGMPVQSETDFLINDPLFKRVYHIYSRGDRIQKLDFFSFDRFFSRRIFKSRRDFKLPEKLMQIQIKCTRNVRFIPKEHEHNLRSAYNFNDPVVIGGKSRYLRNASPGHTELWFFGWTPANYRSNFPLYPLPIVALVPIIVKAGHAFEEHLLFEKPTLIDIRPQHELILIKNQKSKRVLTIAPFFSLQEFEELKAKVLAYMPENYTSEAYMARIVDAHMAAKEEHADYHKHLREEKKARKLARRANRATAKLSSVPA